MTPRRPKKRESYVYAQTNEMEWVLANSYAKAVGVYESGNW